MAEKKEKIKMKAPFDTDGNFCINGKIVKVVGGYCELDESQLLIAITMGYKQVNE